MANDVTEENPGSQINIWFQTFFVILFLVGNIELIWKLSIVGIDREKTRQNIFDILICVKDKWMYERKHSI